MGRTHQPRETRGSLWRFYLLLFSLLMAAVNTGNNLLYLVFSLMVAVGVVSFLAAGRSLRRLQAALRLPEEAIAGRPFLVGVEASAPAGGTPAPWSEAALVGLGEDGPVVQIPPLAPGARTVVCAQARARRRGVYGGFGLRLSSRYPFGLFRRSRRLRTADSVTVTPRRFAIREIGIDDPASQGEMRRARVGDGAELFNIRDYTSQDDARRIDWKASARLDRPMLKEFEKESERAMDLVLDERAAPGEEARRFERLVETAASILDHCEEKGIRARLVVPEAGGARALAGREAMAYLAAVEPRADADPPPPPAAGSGAAPRVVLSLRRGEATAVGIEWERAEERP